MKIGFIELEWQNIMDTKRHTTGSLQNGGQWKLTVFRILIVLYIFNQTVYGYCRHFANTWNVKRHRSSENFLNLQCFYYMSKEEIKYEINKVLDRFSDENLEQFLSFLRDLDSKHNSQLINSDQLHRILYEDKVLLERLAKWFHQSKPNRFITF